MAMVEDIRTPLIIKRISSGFIYLFFFREASIFIKNKHAVALCDFLEPSVLLLFLRQQVR